MHNLVYLGNTIHREPMGPRLSMDTSFRSRYYAFLWLPRQDALRIGSGVLIALTFSRLQKSVSSRIYPSLLYPPPIELSHVAHGHKIQTSSLRRSILRRTSSKFISYGPKDGWADREASRLYTPFLLMVGYQKTQQFCSV